MKTHFVSVFIIFVIEKIFLANSNAICIKNAKKIITL